MRNLAWRALLFALTATTAVIAADALLLKSKQASLNSYSDASVFDASESSAAADAAVSVDKSPAVAHATFSTANSSSSSSNSQLPRLIPLQLLLSPARFRLPQLSPDGSLLAFLQASRATGVNSVFVTALPPSSGSSTSTTSSTSSSSSSTDSSLSLLDRGLLSPVQVTDTPTPIGDYYWSKDGSGILFVVDSGAGTEDYHLYWVPLELSGSSSSSGSVEKQKGGAPSVKVTPGKAVNLTPFKGVKAQGLWLSTTDPSRVFVGLNRRQKSVFDIYSLDLRSQQMTLDTVNPGNVTAWVVNPDFRIGAAVMAGDDGSRHLVYRDPRAADGCPPSASSNSKQPAATASSSVPAAAEETQQQPPQQQQSSSNKATIKRLVGGAQQQQQQQSKPVSAYWPSRIGRRLLQLADIAAAGSHMGVFSSSSSSKDGSGGSNSSSSSSHSMDSAVADSSSKSRVACWKRVYVWPYGEDGRVWGFNQAADGLFITSSAGRDTTELQVVSTTADKPGAIKQRLVSHPSVDINDVIFESSNRQPDAVALDYHKPVWSFAQQEDQQEWDRLEAWQPDAVANLVSRSNDEKVWLVEYSKGNGNTAFYLHRRGTFPPQLLFQQQPALRNYTLAPTHPIVITVRDGLQIPGYLTLPVLPQISAQLPAAVTGDVPDRRSFAVMQRSSSTTPKQQQQQQGVSKVDWRLPMVLMVHGGPWRRTSWGSSASLTQWLANRGYAVLNVNFRGSTGYGKAFSYKGDKQWGVGSMQHDLSDAVAWAVSRGIADPQRVCIMGSSYGGYATFAGLAYTPELYRCGIAFSGMANLADFARAMPPYWGPIKNRWLLRVGNVTADEALNWRISPVFHAHNIRVPLLMGTGGNDVRVTQGEADAMFEALKRQGHKGVQYVVYPDEGHSITRLANRLDYYSRAEQLLAEVLGGRSEAPLRPKLSSAQMEPAAFGLATKVPKVLRPKLLESSSQEVAGFTLAVLHALTYLPLVLLPIMQDAHLKLVVVLNTTLCLCLMAGNVLFHFMGIVKVFPKMLDTFLLALYASMVPVVYLQFSWLQDWINVYHYGAVAAFVWLSILLPCWDSFATEGLKDWLPEALWELPAVTDAGLHMSLVWGVLLTLCAVVTLPPALLQQDVTAVHIVCDFVLVILLLLTGAAWQLRSTRRLLATHTGQHSADVELGDADVGVSVQPQQLSCSTELSAHPAPGRRQEPTASRAGDVQGGSSWAPDVGHADGANKAYCKAQGVKHALQPPISEVPEGDAVVHNQ